MDPLVLILVVIAILAIFGGGFGYRSGNYAWGGGIGVVGLLAIVILVLLLLKVI
jgi:hypothetical protein